MSILIIFRKLQSVNDKEEYDPNCSDLSSTAQMLLENFTLLEKDLNDSSLIQNVDITYS